MQYAMSINTERQTEQLQNLTAVDHYGTIAGWGRGLKERRWESVVWAILVKTGVSGKVLRPGGLIMARDLTRLYAS
jgi:hypothetical protein